MKSKDLYKQLSDKEILDRYRQSNDRELLGILLQRYTILLLGVCLKYLKNEEEAKDAVQQVFSKVISEIDKYPVDHFKSWIYTIARNHCFMQLRNKVHPLSDESLENHLSASVFEHPLQEKQMLEDKESLLDLLEGAIKEIQPNQQQCISLFYIQKKSYRQISDETGFSLMQIKSFIQNGKRNLRLLITKKWNKNAS
ncbi:MAG: sigma-70 family RNA polymerase sigma factor [Chitinophagaceae bacterium]|nr:sigma-70 family RNA polymerase sigma factor [Chitinophagaceae bacterium]